MNKRKYRLQMVLAAGLLFAATIFQAEGQSQGKATYKVAVFIYPGVELLDFAGPLEVFSNTTDFEVFTVAPSVETIVAMNKNIQFIPNYSIENCPQPDIIVFPGANMEGLMPVYENLKVIDWIKSIHTKTVYTMSVCTGAAFLSRAGILDNHSVTTHWGAIEELQSITPNAKVIENKRFVSDGKLLTTAGVSAGLDGALYLVSKIKGKDEALRVARDIEYDKWNPEAGLIVTH
ncbi:MAG: DJ-1/PfpI family protein [Cyclobacteriaceae bacterium]